MRIEEFYRSAQSAGLLTQVHAQGGSAYCAFRSPEETVLDGLALSRDYQIDYSASWMTLAIDEWVDINGTTYQVHDIRAIGDGTECRASLSQR